MEGHRVSQIQLAKEQGMSNSFVFKTTRGKFTPWPLTTKSLKQIVEIIVLRATEWTIFVNLYSNETKVESACF